MSSPSSTAPTDNDIRRAPAPLTPSGGPTADGPPAPPRRVLHLTEAAGGGVRRHLQRLVPELRRDSRVIVREGLNARELRADDLPFAPALVVADLSFISLTLVLPALRTAAPAAELLLMVKPQFEVGRARLGRGGVVRDPAHHVDAVLDVVACGAAHGARSLRRAVPPVPRSRG